MSELLSVSEFAAAIKQPREVARDFLVDAGIPLREIGDEEFFLRELLRREFLPVQAVGDRNPDEVERQTVVEQLRQQGLQLLERRGSRDMIMAFKVKDGWEVGFARNDVDPEGDGVLLPREVVFKTYIANSELRGVTHFTASGFDDENIYAFVFRSSTLGASFVRTREELKRWWSALADPGTPAPKGMRRQGKRSLHLTFSLAMKEFLLERRIQGRRAH